MSKLIIPKEVTLFGEFFNMFFIFQGAVEAVVLLLYIALIF